MFYNLLLGQPKKMLAKLSMNNPKAKHVDTLHLQCKMCLCKTLEHKSCIFEPSQWEDCLNNIKGQIGMFNVERIFCTLRVSGVLCLTLDCM